MAVLEHWSWSAGTSYKNEARLAPCWDTPKRSQSVDKNRRIWCHHGWQQGGLRLEHGWARHEHGWNKREAMLKQSWGSSGTTTAAFKWLEVMKHGMATAGARLG